MNRHRAVGLALVALLAACTTSVEPTTTTTTAVVDTVPDPTPTITTAPSEPTPVDICEDRTAWEANTTHVASCFVVPLAFTPNTDGWRAPKSVVEAIEGI